CGADLRVCRMCGFWDPAANNQCRESQADRVVEKEAANFCDWFRPTQRQGGGETDEAQAARKKLEAVFGQSEGLKGGTSEAEAARKKLEDLFKPKKQTGLKSQD
ncbi:MAG: hypothetical protein OEW12_06705, partial [Deltaproteobacteria bacterium]|nr:hypothetical protein [Deltaproteobacteria bacterium]